MESRDCGYGKTTIPRADEPCVSLVPGTSFLLQSRWPCGRTLDLSLQTFCLLLSCLPVWDTSGHPEAGVGGEAVTNLGGSGRTALLRSQPHKADPYPR